MRGQIEIYSDYGSSTQKMLYYGNNMIVDGFGEQLADLMTITPSNSIISYASSLLDTSNYTIQAISFGKDASGFINNAHSSNGIATSGRSLGQIWAETSLNISSYRPPVTLPQEPSPLDRLLERINSGLSAVDLFGQNLNLIPYYNNVGLTSSQGYQYGCYPNSTGNLTRIVKSQTSGIVTNFIASSVFNLVSSMDWRGFVKKTLTGNASSGLVVSAAPSVSSTCIVDCVINISPGDLAGVELYGGVYSMGLWMFNIKSLICGGRMPPYVFSPINTLDYKLMSKKSLTVDLAKINDNGGLAGQKNYSTLTLVWRLTFN